WRLRHDLENCDRQTTLAGRRAGGVGAGGAAPANDPRVSPRPNRGAAGLPLPPAAPGVFRGGVHRQIERLVITAPEQEGAPPFRPAGEHERVIVREELIGR